jgi:putative restriction endonuclease
VSSVLDQTRIRLDAINHVRALRERWIAVPGYELLRFWSGGQRIVLRATQGIFKPKELSEPLSVQSTLQSPYSNALEEGRKIRYHYLPRSKEHENEGLKRCGAYGMPLIYFLQTNARPDAEYEVFAPAYITAWDDDRREFLIDLSGEWGPPVRPSLPGLQMTLPNVPAPESAQEIREVSRGYLVHAVQRRICHARFRGEVLRIYGERCAVCLLPERALLDAAYLGDDLFARTGTDAREGIALCALHLAAYNAGLLSWDDAYIIRVRPSRASDDGQRSLLSAFDGKPLALPQDESFWPIVPTG